MKNEEEIAENNLESVPSSSETITNVAVANVPPVEVDKEEKDTEKDEGPEYFQFQCVLCSFDVRARYGDLKIGKLEYQGKVYYTRSPFREFDRTKKVTLRDFVIVGTKCCQCFRDVCVKIQCSFYYEQNYCIPCIMQNRGNFPNKVIEVCNFFIIKIITLFS
uniref:Cysteine-rich DPF motif domain-containing protein 1 n=1 Tax=Panagrolaimus superbus TaxID=310955 RepID=A0A914Z0T6_9BILA